MKHMIIKKQKLMGVHEKMDQSKVRFIKNEFIVKSDSSSEYHTLDRSLNCSCDGFFYQGHCKHQKIVEEYINSGNVSQDLKLNRR